MHKAAIAIDLGGTKCAGALVDGAGRIILSEKQLLDNREGDEVAGMILNLCMDLASKAGKKGYYISGIGISVPGISHPGSGKVWAPNIPGWDDFPLKAYVESGYPGKVPVVVDNDRACCILGETWIGAAKGRRNAIFLTVGTGIGAGILVDGRILRGADDIAGAIGWLALETGYREGYRQFGCFEYHASGDGLVREARDLLENIEPSSESLLKNKIIDASAILEAFKNNDQLAVEVIHRAIELWGKACANLVSLFNPEMIIFGGGLFGPASFLIDRIYEEAVRWAQPVSIRKVRILGSTTGSHAPLLGAARNILRNDTDIQ